MKKTCNICKQEKSLDQFHKRSKAKDGLQNHCGECSRARRVANYKTAHGRSKSDAYGKKYSYQNKLRMLEYLNGKSCMDCGVSNPIVLEFDHVDPSVKSFTIGGSAAYAYSWARIEKEIAKCEIRCANCHRIKTAYQFGYYKAVMPD